MNTALISPTLHITWHEWHAYGSGHEGKVRLLRYLVCYQLIAKSGNKTATHSWPDPYADWAVSEIISTLRPRQNGRHFADDVFKFIFLNENVWILIKISLRFVLRVKWTALVQIIGWRHQGDKPLFERMMVSLPMQLCVTWPRWVNIVYVDDLVLTIEGNAVVANDLAPHWCQNICSHHVDLADFNVAGRCQGICNHHVYQAQSVSYECCKVVYISLYTITQEVPGHLQPPGWPSLVSIKSLHTRGASRWHATVCLPNSSRASATCTLTLKHRETHGCVISTVATDALVLKHQAISTHNAD